MNQIVAMTSYADRLDEACDSRHTSLEKIFNSDFFTLSSLMGPISDGPEWPSDASWLALAHDDCACIISDGLSDPWVDRDRSDSGLGLEVFVESPDVTFSQDAPMAIADTWMFPMTAEISHTLASYPRLCEKLINGEPLSLRFNIEHIKDGRGLVGALLHRPPHLPDIQIANGSAALIAATLIKADELRWLTGRGIEGRRTLMTALYEAGVGSRSILNRPSVVGDL
ncbi:hypothetical protein P886_0369 [Alteromonadaceae bacterium 2753L.S.0a.02]|nr:hypothetical protein P886_0369 [Alteromonadaceae bacterium 2753L.S.0a.02]